MNWPDLSLPGRRVVVVGASIAGFSAARALREAGFAGQLVLLGGEPHPPYDRTVLSKQLMLQEGTPKLPGLAAAEDLAALAIEWRPGVKAVGLETSTRRVGLGEGDRLHFDGLVIATGARARALQPLSAVRPLVLRSFADACALHGALRTARHVLVVGGGFIGTEIAAAARARDLEVTLVEAGDAPLTRVLGPQVGTAIASLHRANGVDLRCRTAVRSATRRGDGNHVELSDGTALSPDTVVLGVGAEPETAWLADSGLELDDGVLCAADGTTAVPGVVAAGDVARFAHPELPLRVRVEHWQHAEQMGELAAHRLVSGPDPAAVPPQPFVWTTQYGHTLQVVGWPAPEHTVELLSGDLGEGRWVIAYRDGERVWAAASLNDARALRRLRRVLPEAPTLATVRRAVANPRPPSVAVL